MPVASLTFGDLTIEGASRAGEETWFRVRPPGLAFDAGRGAVQMAGVSRLFLSHGHLDHALGVPYLLSLRQMRDSDETTIYAPTKTISNLKRFIEAAELLEGGRYRYRLHPLRRGDQVTVGRNLIVEAFPTDHQDDSLGFHLLQLRKRLKEQHHGRSGDELSRLRADGVEIESTAAELWLSYCGDTGPMVFELEPRLFEAQVLLMECTFADERSRDNARRYKHMHLDDLVERSTQFRNRELVLHHLSRRYDYEQIREEIKRRLILNRTRVHVFGCD